MTSVANKTSTKRRLLLASDRSDQSSELASILRSVGQVDTIATSDIPDAPERDLAGIVVDINLRSAESVQLVRNKLRADSQSAASSIMSVVRVVMRYAFRSGSSAVMTVRPIEATSRANCTSRGSSIPPA